MEKSYWERGEDGEYHHYIEKDGKNWEDGGRTGFIFFKKELSPVQIKKLYGEAKGLNWEGYKKMGGLCLWK